MRSRQATGWKTALAIWLLAVFCTSSSAQIVRSFTERFTTNTPGDIAIIGNTLQTSPTVPPGATWVNNDYNMVRVDVDSDNTTSNSSSAELTIPSGGSILFARLYWGAGTNAATGGVRAPNPSLRGQVKLGFGAGGYTTVTADSLDSDTVSSYASMGRYQGTKDITSYVQSHGAGTYWVADVQSGTGQNTLAGWAIVVVYTDPTAPPRNLSVFDGYANIFSGGSAAVDIPVSGFTTPRFGTVNTRLGWVVYEGDNGGGGGVYLGEQVTLNGTVIPSPTDALNPQNDCFNSSITRLGVRITSKNPDYANQLGFDADVVNANGVLPNNASNTTIHISSNGEQFYPGAITFATELYAPVINIPKTVSDVNGGKINPGDTLEYTMNISNTGGDNADNVILTDPLPAHTSYVTNSFSIVSGPNTGAKTDAVGDDQYDFSGGVMTIRLGTGADATHGGVLTTNQSTSIKFRVTVNLDTPDGTSITNQATLNYSGLATGVAYAQASTVASVQVDAGIKGRVFEDLNYGGGAGRSFSNATAAVGRPNARVELYDAGNNFVRFTLTDANGAYVFSNVTAAAYSIRVVNSTVSSSRTGGGTAGLVPVQTFRTDASSGVASPLVNLVGGANPGATDPGNSIFAGAQSVSPVLVVTNLYVGDVDFAYNFDTIVNTNDTGQGSLRQFIANANALGNSGLNQQGLTANQETSIFMIPNGSASPGLNASFNFTSGGVATIAPSSTLPAVTDAVILDGGTQPGFSSTPVVQLSGQNSVAGVHGITVTAGSSTIRHLAINRFGGNGIVLSTAGGNTVSGVFLGTDTAGGAALGNGLSGVFITSPNNTIGGTTTAARNVISGNQRDGVQINGAAATGNQVQGNYIGTDVGGTAAIANPIGVQVLSNAANNVVGGTVAGAGNTIANNTGAGIVVTGAGTTGNQIRRNSTFANGGLGIDLENNGVTVNDTGDTDSGGNTLLNFPIISSATISGGNLVLSGFARTNSQIEVFIAAPDPTGFGEGQTYLTTLQEGSAADTDSGTGSYSNPVNGLNQGADTTARFSFTIPLPGGVGLGTMLTATATDASGNTSEFNGRAGVGGLADVAVFKSGPTNAVALTNITYTISVTNGGPVAAVNVAVADTLPTNTVFVSATAGGTNNNGVIGWPVIASFANGASSNFTVTVTTPASGTLTNIASATATTADPIAANNDGSAAASRFVTTITPLADVTVFKTGPTSVLAATNFAYSISVTNNGPSSAAGVVVIDTLPTNVVFVSASAGGVLTTNTVTWPAIPSLASGAATSLTVLVTAPASGSFTNVASASSSTLDPNPANNNGTAVGSKVVTTVTPFADIAVYKTGATNALAGTNLTYTITVTNSGPSSAANVVVTDTLPSGVTFVGTSGNGTNNGGVVTWPAIASLASGVASNFTVTITAPASGSLTNVVSSASDTADPNAANNNGSAAASRVITAVTPQADIATIKTGPTSVNAGTNVAYTITVTNSGPSSAISIAVTDTLPPRATFVSASGGATNNAGVVGWPAIASLAAGASINFTVTITAPASGVLTNTVSSVSETADPNAANNNGTDSAAKVITAVNAQADLATSKSGPASVSAGANAIYTITVTNAGPSAAVNVAVSDTLPSGATFVSASDGATNNAGVVGWPTIASLAAGASSNFTVTITAPASGVLTNTATASSPTGDPNGGNNSGTAITTVSAQADLATSKSGPASVSAGANAIYTITVTNAGPSAAVNVAVSDTLPSGATFVSASGGATNNAGVVGWPTIASLAAGASSNFTVTITAPASGVLTNTATASSPTGDPNGGNNTGSAITTVSAQADLATSKSGPASVSAGANAIYTITVTNSGPSTAANVIVTDTLPTGVTFVSASGGATNNAGAVGWPAIASLAAGASSNFTVTITAPASGVLTNTATATSPTGDPNGGNNTGSAITTVSAQADLATSKSGPASVSAGANAIYTITVTNSGPSAAANVAVSDTLPSGATFVSASGGATNNAGVVGWPAIASLAAGASSNFTVTITAPASGVLTNTATATSPTGDPNGGNNSGTAITTVSAQADLATSKSGPASVSAGANAIYTITVTNAGPSTAANVAVTDTLPSGATFVSASGGATNNAGVVGWPAIASLAAGASSNFTVTITAPASGVLTNTATATSPTGDPNGGNNTGSAITTVSAQADLATSKSGPASVSAGANAIYTITVTNSGPSAAANVAVSDTLPSDATFVSASDGATNNAGVVGWPAIASLAAGASSNFTVTITAPASGVLTNTATASSPTGDPNAGNNTSAPVITTVSAQADLATSKSGPASVSAGANAIYTITVTNAGPSAAANVAVSDTLPSDATFVSASGGATNNAGVVGWPTIASLAAGASSNFTVTITAPASGALTNTATATSPTGDPNAGNNTSAPVITTVSAQADLATSKSGPASVSAGANAIYTITVTNSGPSTAANVIVTDTLPTGVTFVSATAGGTTNGSGAVVWPPIASLVNGAVTNFTVTVTVPASGTLTNIVSSVSDTADPNAANNNGTDSAAKVITAVNAQADLATSKSGPASVSAGANAIYTITVTNAGPSAAANVAVSDTLPSGATFVSASGGATNNAGVVGWPTIASLAAGASSNFTVTITAPASGALTNTATATSPTGDPNAGNNTSAPVITTVSAQADLATSKSGPASVSAGANAIYTITVTNSGPSTAANVIVTDTLPTGVTFVSATAGGTTNGSGAVVWPPIASLVNGAVTNFTVTVTVPASGTLTNTVSSVSDTADPNAANNNGTDSAAKVITAVNAQADLATSKSGPASVSAGANAIYTITVTNAGPSAAANVAVTDTLPSGATFVSASGGATNNAGVVGWPTIASLAAGASSNFTVTITAPASGVLTNTATASSPTGDPNGGNNTGSAITTVSAQADVITRKTGPANVVALTNFTYTITVTNAGPSAAANVVVSDTLPAGATFVSATGGVHNNGIVTWPAMANFANGATTNFTVTVNATAAGTITNIVSSASDTADPDAANNNGSDPSARVVTVVSSAGVSVGGLIFNDLQPNGARDAGEDWSAGTNVFVNLVQGGAVVQSVQVAVGTGVFTINNVLAGSYTVVIAQNATATLPQPPTGWTFTAPTGGLFNVTVASTALVGEDFGLFHGSRVTGRVFNDNGSGGGTPNNGVQDGSEAGVASVNLKATDASGAATYAAATTDGAGNYVLWLPASAGATTVKIVETNPNGWTSTGGNAGTTGGAYSLSADAVTFVNAVGASYAGVNFADVPPSMFVADGAQTGFPGSTVVYSHIFTAGTAGSVTFSTTNAPSPSIGGWSQVLYRDGNCNGQLDADDPVLSGSLSVSAGDQICILVKEFIPAGAPFNAQDKITVTANLAFANNPSLTTTLTRTDLTTAGTAATAGLTLAKQVDQTTAAPGDTITYTITYQNRSSDNLSNIFIHDSTPSYTTFLSATNGVLPGSLTSVTVTAPGPGSTGPIQWQFTGTLAPTNSGTVTFKVKVAR